MLLLKDADGENLLLSDNGLCLGPSDIPENQLTPHSSFKEALPATVNPKPKGARSGNYKLTLANGYVLLVRTEDTHGRHVRRYTVRKQQL